MSSQNVYVEALLLKVMAFGNERYLLNPKQIKKGQQEDVSKLTTPNDTISPRCVHVGRPAHVFLPARHRSASKVDTLY